MKYSNLPPGQQKVPPSAPTTLPLITRRQSVVSTSKSAAGKEAIMDELNLERQLEMLWGYAGLNTKTMQLVHDQTHGLRSLQQQTRAWADRTKEVCARVTKALRRGGDLAGGWRRADPCQIAHEGAQQCPVWASTPKPKGEVGLMGRGMG